MKQKLPINAVLNVFFFGLIKLYLIPSISLISNEIPSIHRCQTHLFLQTDAQIFTPNTHLIGTIILKRILTIANFNQLFALTFFRPNQTHCANWIFIHDINAHP